MKKQAKEDFLEKFVFVETKVLNKSCLEVFNNLLLFWQGFGTFQCFNSLKSCFLLKQHTYC